MSYNIVFRRDTGVGNSAADIFIINPDTFKLTRVTNNNLPDWYPTWSHDRKKIAWASYLGGGWNIYTIEYNGVKLSKLTKVTSNDFKCMKPRWALDDSQIVFEGSPLAEKPSYPKQTRPRPFIINKDGTNQQVTTDSFISSITNVVMAPTDKIIYTKTRNEGPIEDIDRISYSEIYYSNADGTLEIQLTSGSQDINPQLSPDNKFVLFERGGSLFIMDLTTKKIKQITSGSLDSETCW